MQDHPNVNGRHIISNKFRERVRSRGWCKTFYPTLKSDHPPGLCQWILRRSSAYSTRLSTAKLTNHNHRCSSSSSAIKGGHDPLFSTLVLRSCNAPKKNR